VPDRFAGVYDPLETPQIAIHPEVSVMAFDAPAERSVLFLDRLMPMASAVVGDG
jgi:hypothetical protein